jgi:tRNA uridine 5-carboxymethylaminomethyl modification enzyme
VKTFNTYDIIIVGAGHAGCEAAHIAANLGSKVLLVTMNMETIAKMSCNPAMGGVAKGQIVREIDSLGGMSGIISDYSTMQFRMLNTSKGPAMWSPRTQNDRTMFSLKWREVLEQNPNIDFIQDSVNQVIIEHGIASGVITKTGSKFYAKAVVLTSGTFMNGIIHIGNNKMTGGRMGDSASYGITEQMVSLGLEAGRMKTGTPPRVDGRSLDYTKMEEQPGDTNPSCFSFRQPNVVQKQHSCHITYTNTEVHDILRESLDESPLFNGTITSIGPRYCPSIEDKINRFAERDRHQIFVEPEGWNTVETYINGFSSSLPQEVQINALRKIKGFENAKVFRPGYAIEYDFFYPTQLRLSLETKAISNLFFAGQINGTTGYEEAACQGLMAGINAHQKINDKDALILNRSEAYIGVLIDDLVNKGTKEPYRMFTSRAEYRILLRQDNADLRLMPLGHKIGSISQEQLDKLENNRNNISQIVNLVSTKTVKPQEINPILISKQTAEIPQNYLIDKIISRPQIGIKDLLPIPSVNNLLSTYTNEELEQAEIEVKYNGYIRQEQENVDKLLRLEYIKIPLTFDYSTVSSLSSESREKLTKIKPESIGQASRISGVNPADISVLLIHFGR